MPFNWRKKQNRRDTRKSQTSHSAASRASARAILEKLEDRTFLSVVPVATGVPALSSNPTATAKLFLDFDGAPAHTWAIFNAPNLPAYDTDGDPTTFNNVGDSNIHTEIDNIRNIWARVAEKFSPFNVDVTTIDPGVYADKQALRIIVGGNDTWIQSMGWTGAVNDGGFYNSGSNTGYVFSEHLAGAVNRVADGIAQIAARGFGLQPQSTYDPVTSYKTNWFNPGNSAVAPIMGQPLWSTRGVWWNGPSSIAFYNTTTRKYVPVMQNDVALLSGTDNGFGYRPDDHGGSISTATLLSGSGTVSRSGIIEQTTDSDYFSFTTSGGQVTINAAVAPHGAMLNPKLTVFNSAGATIASADTATLGETLSLNLAAGTYYVAVSGHGWVDAYSTTGNFVGQSADLGQYTLSVSAPSAVTPTVPTAATNLSASATSTSQVNLTWTDNSTNETGFTIERATNSSFTAGLATTTIGAGVTSYSATGLAGGTTYYFRVRATNSAGASANSNTAYATTQSAITLPAAPGSLAASSVSTSQINLFWSDNSSNETGFKVERATNSTFSSGLTSVTLGAGATSYSATGLASGITYYFRVRATSSAGDSANSNTAYATTATAAVAPAAPSGAVATAVSGSQINLAWSDNSGNETGFKVQRATNSTFTSGLTTMTLGANVTSYSATGLTAGTTYYFRVQAVNATGGSAYSNLAYATATAPAPIVVAAPSALVANAVSTGQINLSWTDNSTLETGFKIERATNSTFTSGLVTLTAGTNVTSYSATGLTAGTTYYFRVRALGSTGESANSNTASATTHVAALASAPLAPANVTWARTSNKSVKVSWSDMSNNETGFVIQYSSNGGATWNHLTTRVAGTTSFAHATRGTFSYRVAAVNLAGQSEFVTRV